MKYIFSLISFLFLSQLLSAQDSISVLFVGNSYTYVNDLPATLSSLAQSMSRKVTYQTKANGGYTFQNHATDASTYSAMHAKNWDVVVLQGQSQEPSFPYDQVNSGTLPYAHQLSDSAYAINTCGNVMYYMTWGREAGDSQWDSINTFDKMNQRLYAAYLRIADSSHSALVAPVGAVWKYVRDQYPTIGLYASDGSHPSEAGTYLAACTFYAALFRSSPDGASFVGNLDQQTATQLQQAAANIVLSGMETFHLHPLSEPTFANFFYDINNLTVQFTNLSAQSLSYAWDFGDGMTAVQEYPQHTYSGTGSYPVQLVVQSACNTDTLVRNLYLGTAGLDEMYATEPYWVLENDEYIIRNVSPESLVMTYNALGQRVAYQFDTVQGIVRVSGKEVWVATRIVNGDKRYVFTMKR